MFWNFKSIRVKYTLICLIICLISLSIISIVSYMVSYNITLDLSDKRIYEKVLGNSSEINHWFRDYEIIIESLSQDIEASNDFSEEHLEKLLKSKAEIYKNSAIDFYIGFEDENRKFLSGVNWIPSEGYVAKYRDWYIEATENDEVVFTEPYVDAMTNEFVITVSKSLKENDKIIGVLAIDIYLTDVIKVVNDSTSNENSYGILLDETGRIIVHPNPEFLPTEEGYKEISTEEWTDYENIVNILMTNGNTNRIEGKDFENNDEVFHFNKIPSNGWFYGIALNKNEYGKPLKNLLIGFIGAFLISVIIGIIVMFNLMEKMVRPLKDLNDKMQEFSSENMSVRASVLSEDEIGQLGVSFNNMASTIEDYSRSLEKKVEERTHELKLKNDVIIESIEYARKLQNAIIPNLADKLNFSEENYFSIWRPRDIVGGDIFWADGNENRGLLILADCTGHGVPGALMSMMLNSIIDSVFRDFSIENIMPSEMLSEINKRLNHILLRGEETQVLDGADIALLFIDKVNKKLVSSSAKLNIFVAIEDEVKIFKGSKNGIGYCAGKIEDYCQIEIPYIIGANYYMITDGFLDQNDENSKIGIGKKGFEKIVKEISSLTMTEQKKKIEDIIEEKISKTSQRDDITIIGFKLL